ncbi:MAG TPA: pyridoxal-phosphate dependent enzyme [Gemmatimonadaceae bacterium]|nr:pyridoxal-phosphate dependent enzyme [Gemmatimonadaceae bacterium]
MTDTPLDVARQRLIDLPFVPLGHYPTPIDDWWRFGSTIGATETTVVAKRDDAIAFGFGGNKVRKLCLVAAAAKAQGADTLITCGGVQSNHCRATAAAATRLGVRCIIVANGERPDHLTANALLDHLLGAEVRYVATRADRAPAMREVAAEVRASGGTPFEIPLGASTPLGALGIARAVGELPRQGIVPDVIVHASSSGGTQAGLLVGCALFDIPARVIGVSADDPASAIQEKVLPVIAGAEDLLGLTSGALGAAQRFELDDTFVGGGYGVPTEASLEAQHLLARTEAVFVDHYYTAKALAALIAYVRDGKLARDRKILFWHTGGQVTLFQ